MKARLPKGMGGGPSNMQGMIKQAQKMQKKMEERQILLDETEYTATSGGGMVEVKMMGTKEIKEVTIKPEIVDPDDIEMLQDLIVAAFSQIITEIEDTNNKEMEKLSGGMNLPGMF